MRTVGMSALGLAVLMAACTADDALDGSAGPSAPPAAVSAIDAADWSRGFVRTLRIRQDEFSPLVLTLRRGHPYVLRLENGDDSAHAFSAPAFFGAIAVKSLSGGEAVAPEAVSSPIDLPPGRVRELAFVPVKDGYYAFADGWTGALLGSLAGNRGLIVIEAAARP